MTITITIILKKMDSKPINNSNSLFILTSLKIIVKMIYLTQFILKSSLNQIHYLKTNLNPQGLKIILNFLFMLKLFLKLQFKKIFIIK